MTDKPFPIDGTTTIVNKGIDGVFKVAVQLAEKSLMAVDPPFTANPIMVKIDNEVIELVANAIYKNFAKWVDFRIIDFETGVEVTDEQKALIALKKAQESGDQNGEAQALATFQKSVVNLTTIDGAANPGHL